MAESPAEHPAVQRPGGRTARVRKRILDATVTLVASHGVAGLRYEDVAELAGVNKTSVYRNWPDRDELISEALVQLAQDEAPLPDTGDLRQDLVDFLTALAASLSTPTGQALVTAMRTAGDRTEVRQTVRAFIERRVAVVERRIEHAVAQGELPPIDAYFLAELLSGPVHLYVTRGIREFTRVEAEMITDIVLAGVRTFNR
ncbi:TetR/AcrR family transcriptional regulator [Amycolatopsis sp. NPDC088138]|uniref:TetR/AcrR family transcriptional regulator n=1 Tax=Amycolatopsis sp. NPDC088138 TaxID=3363938 RepID=UPI003815D41C